MAAFRRLTAPYAMPFRCRLDRAEKRALNRISSGHARRNASDPLEVGDARWLRTPSARARNWLPPSRGSAPWVVGLF